MISRTLAVSCNNRGCSVALRFRQVLDDKQVRVLAARQGWVSDGERDFCAVHSGDLKRCTKCAGKGWTWSGSVQCGGRKTCPRCNGAGKEGAG